MDVPSKAAERAEGFIGRDDIVRRVASWLEGDGSERVLLVIAQPGMGKTALMAWLAGAGDEPANPELAALRRRVSAAIDAVHFCTETRTGSDATLDPSQFSQSLARQLGRRFATYSEILARQASIVIHAQATAERNFGDLVAVRIANLYANDPATLYWRVLAALEDVVAAQPRRVVILVDGLDEAELWRFVPKIGELLAGGDALAPEIRFLVSTRPLPNVNRRFRRPTVIDLDASPGDNRRDVLTYVRARLSTDLAPSDADLAARIAQTSTGNFLVAKTVLDYWEAHRQELGSTLELPPSGELDEIYHTFLGREYDSVDDPRWTAQARPVLGILGVAQAPLSAAQLAFVVQMGDDGLQDALRRLAPYLSGAQPDGPFDLYHQSFREFLFDADRNPNYTISSAEAHRTIAKRYIDAYGDDWQLCDDRYGIGQLAIHLLEAARSSHVPTNRTFAELLAEMAANTAFQRRHLDLVGDVRALQQIHTAAVEAVCIPEVPTKPVRVVGVVRELEEFQAAQGNPRDVFRLAEQGDLQGAEHRLDLLAVEPRWRQACLLVCVWLAGAGNQPGAMEAFDRLRGQLLGDDELARLAGLVAAELSGAPRPLPLALPKSNERTVRAMLDRVRGSVHDAELLYSATAAVSQIAPPAPGDPAGQAAYLGAVDGPHLVGYAAKHPDPGGQYVDEYLRVVSANGYVLYRNRSLWGLLPGILSHPDLDWIRRYARRVVEAALGGSQLQLAEELPVARRALQARLNNAPATFQDLAAKAEREAALVPRATPVDGRAAPWTGDGHPGLGSHDSWGAHKRRLAAVAEALTLVFDDPGRAAALIDLGLEIRHGFAGFEAPACLRLAEAARIADPADHGRINRALERALAAAHCVQDPPFCAQITSRCNALARRWWGPFPAAPRPPLEIEAVVDRFRRDPSAAEFAPIHVVGEQYPPRQLPPVHLAFPDWAGGACTLRVLARLYERPVGDLLRLNAQLSADTVLGDGQEIAIPDPGFAPLMASYLTAEVAVAPGLSQTRRSALIKSLIPLSLADAICLATVLARYLLVAQAHDQDLLAMLPETLTDLTTQPGRR